VSVPAVITVQGVHCLQSNKNSAVPNGNLIEIQANNVVIDLNGFKLGGLAAGTATTATGIFALDRQNITIRNGIIRGFQTGVFLQGAASSGYLVENLLLEQNRSTGVAVQGTGNVIRNNRVVNTGGGVGTIAYGIQVEGASNTVISENIVSGTSETGTAAGIIATPTSTLIEVRGNTVLDTSDATTTHGIDIASSTDVTVIGNLLLNAAGTEGIAAGSSTGAICIDNTIAGFTTATSGCGFEDGTLP
jgi:hypothetical protein